MQIVFFFTEPTVLEITFSLNSSGCFKEQPMGMQCVVHWSGRVKINFNQKEK